MILIKENINEIDDLIELLNSIGVTEFRIMRYVDTGKDDDKYAVPISNMYPIMKHIDSIKINKYPNMNVGWPCGQKFCTTDIDVPLHSDDPTMNIRFDQLTGSCEAGLVWGIISYDGQMRHCPYSNYYFGNTNFESVENIWNTITKEVSKVLQPRASCSGRSVSNICKGDVTYLICAPVEAI